MTELEKVNPLKSNESLVIYLKKLTEFLTLEGSGATIFFFFYNRNKSIFFNLSLASSHLRSLQVGYCVSNLQLVVDTIYMKRLKQNGFMILLKVIK